MHMPVPNCTKMTNVDYGRLWLGQFENDNNYYNDVNAGPFMKAELKIINIS